MLYRNTNYMSMTLMRFDWTHTQSVFDGVISLFFPTYTNDTDASKLYLTINTA